MRAGKWKSDILIWGMVGMALKDVSEVVSLIKSKYMTDDEWRVNLIKLLGGSNVLFVSPSGRNVLLIGFMDWVVDDKIEFKVSWGLFHKSVWEIFDEERDVIGLAASGIVEPTMFERTCFVRYLTNTLAGIAFKGYFKWNLNIGGLMVVFRQWLKNLDTSLLFFEEMLKRFDIRLGTHRGCGAGALDYSNAKVNYRLFLDDSLSPVGEIIVKRDKISVGVGFSEGLFDWRMYYQIRGLANPLEDYIRSMLVNGDI
jgi:hypothetical protein